jgi:hypothetical protein
MSGTIAHADLTVTPPDSPNFSIAAGSTYTYHGRGFVPGESVTAQFPGGAPKSQTATSVGSVDIALVSPPEPAAGGDVTVSAASASRAVHFRTLALVHAPDTAQPQDGVPVSLTGFGASENVTVKIDTKVLLTLPTDQWGSAAGTLPLDTTFGHHLIVFTGAASKVSKQSGITLAQTMAVSPDSGPAGTSVEVTSGPGWNPGETMEIRVSGDLIKTVTANSNGSVDTTIVIDKHPGAIQVTVYGRTVKLTAKADFTVI